MVLHKISETLKMIMLFDENDKSESGVHIDNSASIRKEREPCLDGNYS